MDRRWFLIRNVILLLLVGLFTAETLASRTGLWTAETLASPKVSQSRKKISWKTDLPAAHEQSVATGKPMLLVFTADWCRYC